MTWVAAPAVLLATLALVTASGQGAAGEWRAYVNPWLWGLSLFLVVPIFLAVRRCPQLTAVVFLCAATPQWIVARIVGHRNSAGEGEVDLDFGFLATAAAVVMTVAFAVAATIGWSMRPRGNSS